MEKKDKIISQFGRLVRKKRREKDLTQGELAELTDTHRTYIGSIERGETNPTLEMMIKLSQGMGCSLSDLIPGDKK